VTSEWEPTQIRTPATEQELAVLHAAGIPGQADFQTSTGYTLGLLLVKGLEEAGTNPTRSAIFKNLRAVHDWTAGGLAPGPVDFSKEFSDPPLAVGGSGCEWLLQARGSQFVPVQTAPICGQKRTVG
jgi:branched-chain amino acid transport system substrate-binding protein